MARLLFLIVILAVVLVVIIAWIIASRRWRVTCEEHGDRTEVWVRKGEHHHYIGAAERMHVDYADRILALQSQGQDKANELNSLQKVLGQ
jgi:hypothetical protein